LDSPIPDLSCPLEIDHRADAVFERHVGIHRMELVECDLLDASALSDRSQPAQR
jgi:hypothetical protein